MLYSLAPYAHVCIERHAVIWLNVREDRYIGQSREAVSGLSRIVKDWPGDHEEDAVSSDRAAINAERLVAKGLLIRGDGGRGATPVSLPIPCAAFRDAPLWLIPPHHIFRLRRARCTVAHTRGRSLEHALERVRERKSTGRPSDEIDTLHTERLLSTFRRLRPLFYGSHNECLNDSLVLTEFLADGNVRPTFVMGVRMRPFSAHCWLQIDRYVLNDHPSNVQRYIPILAI